MNEAKIKVQNVTKVFGKSPKQGLEMLNNGMSKKDILEKTGMTIGVNRANFEVHPGEIFVIMGLSGSGKSTLVRMINRLIEPTTGQVLIDNQDIVKLNANELREVRRKKLGMVFQQFALFPHRTVLGNVQYGLEIRGADKGLKTAKAMEALRQVGLEGYQNSFPSELSGGMQQRVGLARALANDPDILLMDEAFSALDPLIRKDMQDELLNLQDSMKKTIVFITHDLDEALRIGDRIALMKDGEIVQIGTAEEILTKPANEYVERFVEDVDFSKVLTAGHIMKRPEHIRHDRGPRVALQIMRDAGISSVYIVDKTQTLLGAITAQAASEAVKDGKSLLEAMSRDIQTVTPETLIVDLLEKTATATLPVAVVDNGNHLKGIIVRGAVLAALAGEGIHLEGKEEK
jgi:glycine betaine/proline transport system ATP-binding protein